MPGHQVSPTALRLVVKLSHIGGLSCRRLWFRPIMDGYLGGQAESAEVVGRQTQSLWHSLYE